MRNHIITFFSISLVTSFVQPVVAQEATRIIADSPSNRFFAQYEVVEDHPSCSNADQVAFRVPLLGDALEYGAYDPAANVAALVSGGAIITDRECYITQRSGTDRRQIPIPCAGDNDDGMLQFFQTNPVSVALDGHAVACMSPLRTEIVGGEWSVTITSNDSVEVHSGMIGPRSPTRVELIDVSPATAYFHFHPDGYAAREWPWESRSHPFVRGLKGTSAIRVDILCIPFETLGHDEEPLLLAFRAAFAITDGTDQSCTGEGCPSFHRTSLRTYEGAGTVCANPRDGIPRLLR